MGRVARRAGIWLAVLFLVAMAGMARGASTERGIQARLVKYVGPLGVNAGQSVRVVATNASPGVKLVIVRVFSDGVPVASSSNVVELGSTEVLEWVAPDFSVIWGTVTVSGVTGDQFPVALHVYDPLGGSPALSTEVTPVQTGKTMAAFSPFVPILADATYTARMANLGPVATLTVSFFDHDGVLQSEETVTVASSKTSSVEFKGDPSNGVRAEGTSLIEGKFLVTGEVETSAGRRIAYVYLSMPLD